MKLQETWYRDTIPMILLRGVVAELLGFLIVQYVPKAKGQYFLLLIPVFLTVVHLVIWCLRCLTRYYRSRRQLPTTQHPLA